MNWFTRWFTIPSKYNSIDKILRIFGLTHWNIISSSVVSLISKGVDTGVVDIERVASIDASKLSVAVISQLSGVNPAFAVELEATVSNLITENMDKTIQSFAGILKVEITKLLGV
jgi:hypothetical protein